MTHDGFSAFFDDATPSPTTPSSALLGPVRLAHLGVIRVQGPDAAAFLQGQLTQDVAQLAPGQARLAAWCSAKGRMLASFVALSPAPEVFWLVCSRDLLAPTLKRLSMFVLRAKCQLGDASEELLVWGDWAGGGSPPNGGLTDGLAGALVGEKSMGATNNIATNRYSTWTLGVFDEFFAVQMPVAQSGDAQAFGGADSALLVPPPPPRQAKAHALAVAALAPRRLCVGTVAAWEARALAAPQSQAAAQLSLMAWHWAEVMSGVATLSAPVADAFVPQMLNYESVDGVNFKKGCYPGQEVVARSQFRGTLKRRAYRAACAQPLAVGAEVFHSADWSQPCGQVVQVAASPLGGYNAIVSMQTRAGASGTVHTGADAQAEPLSLLALPYPLRDDL